MKKKFVFFFSFSKKGFKGLKMRKTERKHVSPKHQYNTLKSTRLLKGPKSKRKRLGIIEKHSKNAAPKVTPVVAMCQEPLTVARKMHKMTSPWNPSNSPKSPPSPTLAWYLLFNNGHIHQQRGRRGNCL